MSVGRDLAELTETAAVADREMSEHRGMLRRLLRDPAAVTAAAVLLVVIFACALAPWLAPSGPLQQNLTDTFAGPSGAHWLGTDPLGRDILVRLMYGGRPTLLAIAIAVVVYCGIGIVLGMLGGYLGGWLDVVVKVLIDLLLSIPAIVVLLAVVAVFNSNENLTLAAFGLVASGGLMRVVRAETHGTRSELYVDAADLSGVSTVRILTRHILPRLYGPILIQASLFAGVALGVEAGLGFLGLGVAPPNPSWGNMVGEASSVLSNHPWLLLPSGGIIAVVILCCAQLGDSLRDASRSRRTGAVGQHKLRQARRAAALSCPDKHASEPVVTAASPASEGPPCLLAITDLSICFITPDGGASEVVHGVSLQVRKGEFVALVGESGSGKTVTARAVLGLLPGNGFVCAGTIALDGRPIHGLPERQLAAIRGSRIAMISQEPMSALDPFFTVGSQLGEILRRHRPLRRAQARKAAIELLQMVRLRDAEQVLSQYPFQLSGGMAQRVAIAMALAGDPELLIADEPTTALDVTVQAEILDLLRMLRDSRDMSILLVTHDLGVVADVCERAIVMRRGVIVESKPVDLLFARPEHAYTQALLAATPRLLTGTP